MGANRREGTTGAHTATTGSAGSSPSTSSGLRPEIKGALIGFAIGAGVGMVLNAAINDVADAGSYAKAIVYVGGVGALLGYGGGAKLGHPSRTFWISTVLSSRIMAIRGNVQLKRRVR
jgi:hypothetical protein